MARLEDKALNYSREACIVSKDASLSEALRHMKKCKSDRVLLRFKDGSLRGITTKRDILWKLATERTRMTEPSSWRISGFMSTPLIKGTKEMSVGEAVGLMAENGITSLPLIENDGETVLFDKFSIAEMLADDERNVLEISRTPPVTLRLTDRLLHARMKLQETGLSIIPVLDDNREFLGVIGIDEVLEVFIEYYETLRESPKHLTEINNISVDTAVRLRPPTVNTGSTVGEATSLMLKTGYRGVVVLDNTGKPVGIITGDELINYLNSLRTL